MTDDLLALVAQELPQTVSATLDAFAIERFTSLLAERIALATKLAEHGPLLSEPIVTPRGDIAGERLVANPVVAMLRAIDRALDSLSDRLGLSPASRGSLGLLLSAAERNAAASRAVLAGKYGND